MDDKYRDLCATIYASDAEMKRFRQLIVNSVMATDIVDKELKQLRNNKWERAFSEQDALEDPRKTKNRKATIVIEHLIQASKFCFGWKGNPVFFPIAQTKSHSTVSNFLGDVAHTMQHWHIYRKWNTALFEEMYKAYKEGRAEKDPAEFWYVLDQLLLPFRLYSKSFLTFCDHGTLIF